jgi:hypothetical protein
MPAATSEKCGRANGMLDTEAQYRMRSGLTRNSPGSGDRRRHAALLELADHAVKLERRHGLPRLHAVSMILSPVRAESSCTTTPSIGSTSTSQGARSIMRTVSAKPASQRVRMPAGVKSMSFR